MYLFILQQFIFVPATSSVLLSPLRSYGFAIGATDGDNDGDINVINDTVEDGVSVDDYILSRLVG